MAIKGTEERSILSKGGKTENNIDKLYGSQQHNEYSLNGQPSLKGKPSPSRLDLDGKTPKQYISNLPN